FLSSSLSVRLVQKRPVRSEAPVAPMWFVWIAAKNSATTGRRCASDRRLWRGHQPGLRNVLPRQITRGLSSNAAHAPVTEESLRFALTCDGRLTAHPFNSRNASKLHACSDGGWLWRRIYKLPSSARTLKNA